MGEQQQDVRMSSVLSLVHWLVGWFKVELQTSGVQVSACFGLVRWSQPVPSLILQAASNQCWLYSARLFLTWAHRFPLLFCSMCICCTVLHNDLLDAVDGCCSHAGAFVLVLGFPYTSSVVVGS